jgi:sodium-dependent phosphate transporter
MTKLTNSRGYCAELTAAIIVIVSSRYGFPVSTTQVITGAITGIGISEVISAKLRGQKNAAQSFNWLLLLKFFGGWVATLLVAGLTSAAFTAQGIYSPSRSMTDSRASFNSGLNVTNTGMVNTLAVAGAPNATAGQAQALTWAKALNASIVAWTKSNNLTLLESSAVLDIFQQGSWYLGNSTVAGALNNTYMPVI